MDEYEDDDGYVDYMCDLYEDIHGKKPSQDWVDALRDDDYYDEG